MTDVLILKRIAGHRPGAVTPLTDRLQKHVDAGNAKIMPIEGESAQEPPRPQAAQAYAPLRAVDDDLPSDADAFVAHAIDDDEDTDEG